MPCMPQAARLLTACLLACLPACLPASQPASQPACLPACLPVVSNKQNLESGWRWYLVTQIFIYPQILYISSPIFCTQHPIIYDPPPPPQYSLYPI